MKRARRVMTTVFLAVVLPCAPPVAADVCQVPSGTYPTIQAAVGAPICTEIVLAAQTFEESVVIARNLVIGGASAATTVIEGRLLVQGGSTVVSLEDLTVNGSASGVAGTFTEALHVADGAELSGSNIVVLNAMIDQRSIFDDGFESGNTTAWSTTVP